jgi:hypothetical protein
MATKSETLNYFNLTFIGGKMCNINIIINRKGKKTREISECMNAISFNSFLKNSHAEGYFDETFKIKKAVHKLIYTGEHSLLISHQRIATSGHNAEMAQPIEIGDFIIAHNGVITGLGNDTESDTYELLKEIAKEYETTNDTVKAIQNVTKEHFGTYSIVLYNKKTDELIYFKETMSNMFVLISPEYILMSTLKDNVEYMQKYYDLAKYDISEVEPLKIFNLRTGESLGTFEKKTYVYSKNSKGWSKESSGQSSASQTNLHAFSVPRDARDQALKVLEWYGIEPISVGVNGDTMTIGIPDTKLDRFEKAFLTCEYIKKKKDKLLYNVPTKTVLQEFAYIKEQMDWTNQRGY